MKKIILDCDPGMDDSVAIIMACKSPDLDVLAVTTLNGNYPADVTAANAQKVLEMLGKTHIPVAKGMGEPMVSDIPKDPFTHGEDGQANNNLPYPSMPLSEKHAVSLIIDIVKKYPKQVTLICTGPLSNVAMAIKQAPEIKEMIHDIVAISGTFGLNEYAFLNATGDTPQSEWNVYVDPEAAKIVYESGIPFTALGLDVATYFDVDFSNEDIEKLRLSSRQEAAFLANAVDFVRGRGFNAYCAVIDCMAVAYAIHPALVTTKPFHVGVETKPGLTYGMTVRDGRHHHIWEHLPLIDVAIKADYKKFLEVLVNLVLK